MVQKVKIKYDEFGLAKFISEYKTTAQREQEGKDKRIEVPREVHAEFETASDRPDPVSIIKNQVKAGGNTLYLSGMAGCPGALLPSSVG